MMEVFRGIFELFKKHDVTPVQGVSMMISIVGAMVRSAEPDKQKQKQMVTDINLSLRDAVFPEDEDKPITSLET